MCHKDVYEMGGILVNEKLRLFFCSGDEVLCYCGDTGGDAGAFMYRRGGTRWMT
jgi:hypothetical protein